MKNEPRGISSISINRLYVSQDNFWISGRKQGPAGRRSELTGEVGDEPGLPEQGVRQGSAGRRTRGAAGVHDV